MAYLLSIIFFFGLLVALAVLLEVTLKAHFAEIVAALRGAPPVRARPRAAVLRRRAAA